MKNTQYTRRKFLTATGAAFASATVGGVSAPFVSARATEKLAASRTMRGGANNYTPGAPIVDRIGGGGFWMTGTVRRAGDGALLEGQRIQIWAHTTEGHERDWHSHGAAAMSPLLAWREPIYIVAGFAGIIAITLMLLQPVLAAGYLPGLSIRRGRDLHRWVGCALVLSLVIHVAGLWLTSPPDVVDALLFNSPTPFSNWGVIAMWAVFASACLALFRRRFRSRLGLWRLSHKSLAGVIVIDNLQILIVRLACRRYRLSFDEIQTAELIIC